MRVLWMLIVLAGMMIASCQPAADTPQTLPTLAVLPSLTPVEASPEAVQPTVETGVPPTSTPLPTEQAEATETEASTEAPPTATPVPAVTIEIREEVRFATLTPDPQGAASGTPLLMADVVITQGEFQRAVDAALGGRRSIQAASVDFVPDGIEVELTALGGVAYITGRVKLLIQVTGSFAAITVDDIQINAPEPPEAYLEIVNGEFFALMIQVLDSLLRERVGDDHDLENILLNDEAMQIFLLVPSG